MSIRLEPILIALQYLFGHFNSMKTRWLLFVWLFVSIGAGNVSGQSEDSVSKIVSHLFEMSLEELLVVPVTTSTQTSIAANIAPSNIYTFTGDEIRRYGMRSVNELLSSLVPGIVNTEDGDESIAAFRGVATDNNAKVQMLINGHKVDPQWAKGATPELELGLMEDIDRVEVIVGPGSALYGSGATIGVVNIITKTTDDASRFCAFTSYGTGDNMQLDVSSSVKVNDDLRVSMSGGALKSDGYPRRDGSSNGNSPMYIAKHPMSSRIFAKIDYNNTEVSARYTCFGRSLYNTVHNPLKANPYEIWDYAYLEVRHTFALGGKLSLRLNGGYDTHQTRRYDYLRGYKLRAIGENHVTAGGMLTWVPNDRTIAIVGAEYSKDKFGADWSGDNFNISPVYDTVSKTININPTYENRIVTPYQRDAYGCYGQLTQTVNADFSLIAGFRYDYIYAPGQAWNSALTPRVGAVYSPVQDLTAKLMFSSGFRQAMAVTTSPDNYFLGSSAHYSSISAPEQIYSYEFALSYLLNKYLYLSSNLFYNRFTNLHSLAPADTEGTHNGGAHFVSAGTMDFKGCELSLWYKIANHLTVKLTHQFVAPGAKVDDPYQVFVLREHTNQLMFYPENTSKLLVDVHILPWLSANSNAVLVYNNYGYNDRSEVKSSGRYALLNANVVVNTARFLKGDFIISGYNLLDSNPLIPMPTAPGTGTNMVPIAGRNYSLSYRLVF